MQTVDIQNTHPQMEHPIQPDDVSFKDPSFQSNKGSHNDIMFSRSDHSVPQEILNMDSISDSSSRFAEDLISIISPELDESSSIELEMPNVEKVTKFLYLFDSEQNEGLKQRWMLLPSLIICRIWNIVFLFGSIILIVELPLELSFSIWNYHYLYILLKLVDILIQLWSAYPHNGKLIQKQSKIIKNYTHNYLFIDSISLILLAIINSLQDQPIFQWIALLIIILFSLKRMNQLLYIILLYLFILLFYNSEYNQFKKRAIITIEIIKIILLINILVSIHNQIYQDEYEYEESSIRYLKGLQYVLGMLTMNSQLNPITNQQILLFCAISIITPILFAYLLKLFLDSTYYLEEYQMNDFFIQYSVNSEMKPLIFSDPNPKNHMNQLNYVRKHSILSNYFKGYEMDKLEHFTEEVKYSPNDKIIVQSNTDDCSLYFLLEGNTKTISKTAEHLGSQQPMQVFGELSFFTLQSRTATIISESFSTLLKVNLLQFLDRLTSIEKEHYYLQKDQILMESIYPQKCYACHHNTHTITYIYEIFSDCPTLTYKPDRYKVMRKFIKEQKQKRSQYVRRRQKKSVSSLKVVNKLNDLIDRFNDLYSELVVQTSNLSSVSNLPYDDTVMADGSYTRIIDREKDKTIKLSNIFKLRSINNDEDDSQDFLVNRGDNQKHTLSTAGFPNIGSQKHHRDTLNVILEQDSLEAQSQFEDEIGRNEDQKLSIIQHLEDNQSDYINRRQQNQTQKTLLVKQHSRQNSKKNSVDSWACSPIINLPMKSRQQSRSSSNSQKSTMQFTNRFSAIPIQGNNEDILIDRNIEHFERMHLMTIFHPHNNYDVVIDIYNARKKRH